MRKIELLICLALVAAVAGLAAYVSIFPKVALADVDANVTVNVSVQTAAEITVSPTYLFWSVAPGHASAVSLVDISNRGSVNVSQINVFANTVQRESVRPYGSSSASSYSSSGVIVLHNVTDANTTNYFVGRLEWNSTQDVSNMNLGAIDTGRSFGFFRNTSYEYFWGLGNGTDGQCNNSGAQFGLNDNNDNGTIASRTVDTTGVTLQTSTDWGLFSINRANSPLDKYCVAAYYDCKKIYLYKYDKRTNPNFGGCANSNYLQEPNLIPGSTHSMSLSVYAPYGIPDGVMNLSTITVYASSA
jgi:hypothetical protein